jgi:hypothetical protein
MFALWSLEGVLRCQYALDLDSKCPAPSCQPCPRSSPVDLDVALVDQTSPLGTVEMS